jgi:hypothetical protein
MKKTIVLSALALFFAATTFANVCDKDSKKECKKEKTACCKKGVGEGKACCKKGAEKPSEAAPLAPEKK